MNFIVKEQGNEFQVYRYFQKQTNSEINELKLKLLRFVYILSFEKFQCCLPLFVFDINLNFSGL